MICGLIRKATRKIVQLKPPESLQPKYTTCSCDNNFRFSFSTRRRLRSTSLRMIRSQSSIGVGGGGDGSRDGEDNNRIMKKSTPVHGKLQQFLHVDPIGGWEECWKEGVTPWDLGQPTPVLLHLHNTGALPSGTALIPGCGTGHDVVAIACPQRHVVGLDISESAINKAIQLSSSSANADYLTFVSADFFNWQPTELFDLIFDYTFFCALEPDMRPAWARRIQDLLKPDGELITLMFPISDHDGGPPYKVSVADYSEVLNPVGLKAMSIVDNELAVGPRRGREKLGRWKRSKGRSFL